MFSPSTRTTRLRSIVRLVQTTFVRSLSRGAFSLFLCVRVMPYVSVGSASSEEEEAAGEDKARGGYESTAVVVLESEADDLAMEMCTKAAHEYYTAAYAITLDLLQAPADSAEGNMVVTASASSAVQNRQNGLVYSLRDYMLKLTRLVEEQARNQSLSMLNEVNAAEKRASNTEKELILLKQKHAAAMTRVQQEKDEARKQVRLLEEELQRVASQHRVEVSQRVALLRTQMMKDYDQAVRTKTTAEDLGAFQQLVSEQARDLELLQAEKRHTKNAQIRLESQLQSLARERQFFSRSVSEAMKKNSALKVCQEENEARIRQAQEKALQLEAAANAMHVERQELQEQMHHRTVDLGTKTTVCTRLEAEVVALRKKNEELEAKVKEDTEIQNIRSKLWETAQAEAVKKDASLRAIQDEFAAMTNTLRSEARDAWAGMQKELLEKEQTIHSLLKDLSNAKVQLKNRDRELATWQDAASQAAELTEQLANQHRQAEAQVHRLAPFEDQTRSLTMQVQKLAAERSREEERKQKATSTHNKSVAAAKEIKAKLRECNISLSEAKKANAELLDQISALKDTIANHAEAQAKFTQQAKLLEVSRGEIEGLVSALNESKEEIKTQKLQLAAVADLPTLQARLRLTEEELDAAKSQNAALETSLRQAEERAASQEAVHAALKKQLLELSQRERRAKENIESFHEERRQFNRSIKHWEKKDADHVSEKEQLRSRILELEGVHGRVELTNHALAEAKESIKIGIEEKRALESAVVKCEALLSASEEATRNLQAMTNTLRSEARDAWAGMQKELLEKEQTIHSLLKDLSNAKVQLKNRDRELEAQTAAKLSAAEKKAEDLDSARKIAERKIAELRGEAERLREREKSLSETVEALDAEKATMVMMFKGKFDAAQLALEKLRAEHASLKMQLQASVAEISGYKVRSKVLSEKLNRMALRVKKLSLQ